MNSFFNARRLAVTCALTAACLNGCSKEGGTPVASNTSATAPAGNTPPASYSGPEGMTGGEPSSSSESESSAETAYPGPGYAGSGPEGSSGSSELAGYETYQAPSDPGSSGSGYGGPGYAGEGSGSGMYGSGMNGLPKITDPAPSEAEDYLTKAKYAFAIGKETVAEQYFIAHLLTNDEQAPQLLQQVRWSPGARKPTTTVRFAVGVDLEAPATLPQYQPIGRSQFAGNNPGGDTSSEYGIMGGGGPGSQAAGGKTLGDMTGKFGEALVTAFEAAWDNGDFSIAFKDVDTINPLPRAANGMAGMNDGSSGMGSAMMGSSEMSGYAGYGGPEGAAPGAAAPADAALRTKATADKYVVPGLLFIGTGKQSDLISKAAEESIDYLFVFDVDVKPQRGMIHNDTRLRLINVRDSANLGTTTVLNNLKVDREMAMKGESDVVEKQIANVFRKIEPLKLTDLPKLEPVHAQARIKSLIEKNSKNVLPTLLEIRLFNSLGLLDNEQRDAAYLLTMGGAGVAFVSGTLEDRDAVLAPLLQPYK